jgi:uncharacterized protein YndB with AHSA1/START domain
MSDVVHDTFVIVRTYAVAPERVFQALADPAKKRRWYAETTESYALDFREGGHERAVSRMGDDTPFPGVLMVSEAIHQDIVPGRRVVIAQAMTIGERRISVALITFEIAGKDGGAELTLTHQAAFLPGADGPAMRKGGWAALLDRLHDSLAD